MPQNGVGYSDTVKYAFVVKLDSDGSCCEGDHAPSVAELTHGEERRGLPGRCNVYPPCGKRKAGDVKFCLVGEVHDGTIGIGDAERLGSDTFVDDGGGDRAEVCGATRVSNGNEFGRNNGWGDLQVRLKID
jgi:hypothetical protein